MNRTLIPSLLMALALGGPALACDKATDAAGPAGTQISVQTVGWSQAAPMRIAATDKQSNLGSHLGRTDPTTSSTGTNANGTNADPYPTLRSDSERSGTELGTGAVGSSTAEDRADRAGTDLNDRDAVSAGLAPFWVALATVGIAMLALGLVFFGRKRFANRNI